MSDHPGSSAPKAGELASIQYLRGIAALIVIGFHLEPQLRRMAYGGPWIGGLTSGVDVFFVISGFIMWVTTATKPTTMGQFWYRRALRIVPLYWFFTAFMTAMMILTPRLLQTSRFELYHVVTSFFFVPSAHPVNGTLEPVVMPGWTLNYEVFFYLIFGLFLSVRNALWRFVGTVAALLALVGIGLAADFPTVTLPHFYTSSVMVEFALGMGLGYLWTTGKAFARQPTWLGWILLVGGLAFAILNPAPQTDPRLITRGIGATFAVAGALVLEARGRVREMAPLHALGNASYSIYLSQLMTLSATAQAWRAAHLPHGFIGWSLYCVFAVTTTVVVGYGWYRLLEMPILRALRRKSRHVAPMQPSTIPVRSPAE